MSQNCIFKFFKSTLGGRVTVQRKHADIQSCHFNSGFFITTNVYPDFGGGQDAEAIRKTVALGKKDPAVCAWLRRNCVEIFHWVANEIKDLPLFSTALVEEESRSGAVYNDFDNEAPFDSDDGELEFSFTQPTATTSTATTSTAQSINQEVDNSILEEGDFVFFDIEEFDCESLYPDREYREKVYKIMEFQAGNVTITPTIKKIFEIRHRNNWCGADSVYDVWLLGRRTPREWFPVEVFAAEYPEYQSVLTREIDNREREQSRKRKRDDEDEESVEDEDGNEGMEEEDEGDVDEEDEGDEDEEERTEEELSEEEATEEEVTEEATEENDKLFQMKVEIKDIITISDSE